MWLITKVLIIAVQHVQYLIKDAITISNYMIVIVRCLIYNDHYYYSTYLQVQIKVTITISDYMITL